MGPRQVEQTLDQLLALLPPESGTRAVRLLMEFYGAGLQRALEIIYERHGQAALDSLGEDPLVSQLMILHDLHPLPVEKRVERALEGIRPQLAAHHGGVTLLDLEPQGEGWALRLRLEGTCNGCPSSSATMEGIIRAALEEAAPELETLVVEGLAPPPPPPREKLLELRIL